VRTPPDFYTWLGGVNWGVGMARERERAFAGFSGCWMFSGLMSTRHGPSSSISGDDKFGQVGGSGNRVLGPWQASDDWCRDSAL